MSVLYLALGLAPLKFGLLFICWLTKVVPGAAYGTDGVGEVEPIVYGGGAGDCAPTIKTFVANHMHAAAAHAEMRPRDVLSMVVQFNI
jgi:hypothetical protein